MGEYEAAEPFLSFKIDRSDFGWGYVSSPGGYISFSKIRSMFMVFDVDDNRPGFYKKQVAGEESFVTKFLPPGKSRDFLGSLLVLAHFATCALKIYT